MPQSGNFNFFSRQVKQLICEIRGKSFEQREILNPEAISKRQSSSCASHLARRRSTSPKRHFVMLMQLIFSLKTSEAIGKRQSSSCASHWARRRSTSPKRHFVMLMQLIFFFIKDVVSYWQMPIEFMCFPLGKTSINVAKTSFRYVNAAYFFIKDVGRYWQKPIKFM